MNKKAQSGITIGQLFVAIFFFAIILISGFTFYLGSIVDNGATIPDGINQTQFETTFLAYEQNLTQRADEINSEKNSVPLIGGAIDFFAGGINSIKIGWSSLDFVKSYLQFAQSNTVLGKYLPQTFWSMMGAIFTILIILIVLGALWRYRLA
jgi:hypothetical protein